MLALIGWMETEWVWCGARLASAAVIAQSGYQLAPVGEPMKTDVRNMPPAEKWEEVDLFSGPAPPTAPLRPVEGGHLATGDLKVPP